MDRGQESKEKRRITTGQKITAGVTGSLALALILAALLGSTQDKKEVVAPGLQISQSQLHENAKTGKLSWNGSVVNHSGAAVKAPWVLVTLYDPAGDEVDTGEASNSSAMIPAGGRLDYSSEFDTRGADVQCRTRLEVPNSHSLGM